MKRPLNIPYLVLLTLPLVALAAQPSAWPTIRPAEGRQTYIRRGRYEADTPFMLLLKGLDGRVLYRLECHNGNYEDESELNFSGTFQCALFALENGHRTSVNLLADATKDEQSTDWFNRGRMLASQLSDECGSIPEYGRTRHFRLRGMLITFHFTDLQWAHETTRGSPKLAAFTFEVTAVPDEGARTLESEIVAVPRPPRPCF